MVVAEFGDMYPELREKEAFVMEIIKEEEEAFSSMLVREGSVVFVCCWEGCVAFDAQNWPCERFRACVVVFVIVGRGIMPVG